MKSAHEQNHSIDVLITRLFSILFWFNPVIWLYQKAILQNLEFIADSEALLKISDKKAYQITLLKITARKLRCFIQSFYQSLIKKTNHHVKQKTIKKIEFYGNTSSRFSSLFIAQVNVVAQEKIKRRTIKVESKHPVTTYRNAPRK
jgi:beta-lactamase regulating signal transducer with metallopeptidase domain